MTFFALVPDGAPDRFRVQIDQALSVGPPPATFLFGGAALGLAVAAIERATARPLVWSTVQFRAPVRMGDTLTLEVDVASPGRAIQQLTAIGRVDGAVAFSVLAAVGERAGHPDHQWLKMPDLSPPDVCVAWPLWPRQAPGGLIERLDVRFPPTRVAPLDGSIGEDRLAMWIRTIDDAPLDAALLAVFADFVPAGTAAALGKVGGGNSLDNTLRVRGLVPTRWIAADVCVQSVARGFAHGDVALFAEDGTLLATASQTLVLRTYEQ